MEKHLAIYYALGFIVIKTGTLNGSGLKNTKVDPNDNIWKKFW